QLGWAKADVAALVKTGIIKGSYGKINGDGTATRAEAATMVKRFLTQVKFI
ncbi:MAG: S-layer homology domain-containing protein, partial [Cohnella sp.]|nr:S-layer homology domain-containing protein [Cohnella sp.]